MEATIHEILAWVLGTFATAAVGWLAKKLGDLINSKVSNDYLNGMLLRLNDAVFAAVLEVEQSYVASVKRGRAPESPEGAKLTAQEMGAAKRAAIEAAKSYLGPKGLAELARIIGIGSSKVDRVIAGKVEAAVGAMKAKGKAGLDIGPFIRLGAGNGSA